MAHAGSDITDDVGPVVGPGYRVLAGFIALAATVSVGILPVAGNVIWVGASVVAQVGIGLLFSAVAIVAWEFGLTGCAPRGTRWRMMTAAALLGTGAFAATAPTLLGLPVFYQIMLFASVFLGSEGARTSTLKHRNPGSPNLPLLYALPLALVGFPGQPGWHGTSEYLRVFTAVFPFLVVDLAWAQLSLRRPERPVVGFRQ